MANLAWFSVVLVKTEADPVVILNGAGPRSSGDIESPASRPASVSRCLALPDHVNIDEILVKCLDQASVHKLHRRA